MALLSAKAVHLHDTNADAVALSAAEHAAEAAAENMPELKLNGKLC